MCSVTFCSLTKEMFSKVTINWKEIILLKKKTLKTQNQNKTKNPLDLHNKLDPLI